MRTCKVLKEVGFQDDSGHRLPNAPAHSIDVERNSGLGPSASRSTAKGLEVESREGSIPEVPRHQDSVLGPSQPKSLLIGDVKAQPRSLSKPSRPLWSPLMLVKATTLLVKISLCSKSWA